MLELILELILILKGDFQNEQEEYSELYEDEDNIKSKTCPEIMNKSSSKEKSINKDNYSQNDLSRFDCENRSTKNSKFVDSKNSPSTRHSGNRINKSSDIHDKSTSLPNKSDYKQILKNTNGITTNKIKNKQILSDIYYNEPKRDISLGLSKKSKLSNKYERSDIDQSLNKQITTKRSNSISFDFNLKMIDVDAEIPLSDANIKNEIKMRLLKIYGRKYYNKLSNMKTLNELVSHILRNMKNDKNKYDKFNKEYYPDYDGSALITKEFLLNHQIQLEKIMQFYIQELSKKDEFKKKIVRKMSANINSVRQIEEHKYKLIEDKINKKKENYNIKLKDRENQIKFINTL